MLLSDYISSVMRFLSASASCRRQMLRHILRSQPAARMRIREFRRIGATISDAADSRRGQPLAGSAISRHFTLSAAAEAAYAIDIENIARLQNIGESRLQPPPLAFSGSYYASPLIRLPPQIA